MKKEKRMDFKIGFWNYVETGILDPKKAVKDWKELGMTLPMSFAYDPKKHKKEDMIALLDECQKEGMKVIVQIQINGDINVDMVQRSMD